MNDDFDDDLGDLIGGAARTAHKIPPSFKPRLTQAEEREDFTERCRACGGSGIWRGKWKSGTCFECKGEGRLVFRTSPEARAKGRARAAAKRKLKAVEAADWREAHKAEIEWLNRNATRCAERGFDFPQKLVEALAQYGTLTDGQLAAVHKLMLRDAERAQARDAARPEMDCSKISAAFDKARGAAEADGEGVFGLRLRLGDFTFTPDRQDASAVWVKGEAGWLGKIVAGRFHRFKVCGDADQTAIAAVCADPSSAARAFGQRWTTCSCCGRTLTNAESRAAGIGPICAERWGL